VAAFLFSSHPKRERDREAHLNYYASAYNRGDNYRITRLKLNWHEQNKHASLTKNTANSNTKQTKPRFGRLLRPPAWKRSGTIFWKVRDRRRDRREGKTHKKGRRKNTNRKGKQKQIIWISHTHTHKSRNQQVNRRHIKITYLLTAPEPARGDKKMGVVLIKHMSESQWIGLLEYLTISTNVRCYYHVIYDNFVFQQGSAQVHLALNTVHPLQCKTSFLLSYGLITVHSLTLLTMRFRESHSSMSTNCK